MGIVFAGLALVIARWLTGRRQTRRARTTGDGARDAHRQQQLASLVTARRHCALVIPLALSLASVAVQRPHRTGCTSAFLAPCWLRWFVWWLMSKTTLGFELRTVGANPNAARYAGINITRNIVVAMAISGALAGLAGRSRCMGVSICRCLPLFFSSGYGFDSIAIALGKNNPFGIVLSSLLFGAMRNGADLMELTSGVSKYMISVIQALVLLFVAAPPIVRWIYRIKAPARTEEEAPLTRGWGG